MAPSPRPHPTEPVRVRHLVIGAGFAGLCAAIKLDEEGIRTFARDNLTPYKVPRRVVQVDELPKSLIGKVLRRKVRESLLDV